MMKPGLFETFLFIISTSPLWADPIVIGSSTASCETTVLFSEPWIAKPPQPSEAPIPSECTQFSGTWTGACYDGIVRPAHPLSTHPRYTAETVLPENVSVPEDLSTLTPLVKQHTVTITQSGCQSVQWETAETSSPFRNLKLDLQNDPIVTSLLRFRRKCESNGHRWDRVYEMGQIGRTESRWSSEADAINLRAVTTGSDPNYNASYRNIRKTRVYLEGERLFVKSAYWSERSKYDPAGLSWDPPTFGGFQCIFERS